MPDLLARMTTGSRCRESARDFRRNGARAVWLRTGAAGMSAVTQYLQPLVVAGNRQAATACLRSPGARHSPPRWPVSLRRLLENVLRNAQRADVGNERSSACCWTPKGNAPATFRSCRRASSRRTRRAFRSSPTSQPYACALAAGISAHAVQPRLPGSTSSSTIRCRSCLRRRCATQQEFRPAPSAATS
jgi:hypothetical protein